MGTHRSCLLLGLGLDRCYGKQCSFYSELYQLFHEADRDPVDAQLAQGW